MPIVGELVAAGMPELVRVDRERQLCDFPGPGNYFQEARSRGGTTAPAISLNSQIEKYRGYCILRERVIR